MKGALGFIVVILLVVGIVWGSILLFTWIKRTGINYRARKRDKLNKED